MSIALLVIGYFLILRGFDLIPFSILILCGVILVLFATLTVEIRNEILEIRFGPGIIHKRFFLKEIQSCRVVKNHWFYGWGIRLTPHGWLYNVSGLDAVEIEMKTGKRYRIGTDQPKELERVLRQGIESKG